MPRYHFHLRNGVNLMDPRGVELPDDEAARQHGAQLAAHIGRTDPNGVIHITNESGDTVARCPAQAPKREAPDREAPQQRSPSSSEN